MQAKPKLKELELTGSNILEIIKTIYETLKVSVLYAGKFS